MDIEKLNRSSKPKFVETLKGIYESSPWTVEGIWEKRPFTNLHELKNSMKAVVEGAGEEMQVKLIQAHPDLGGKLGLKMDLTEESQREQSRLGLDCLEEKDYEEFVTMNRTYREKFGFPFIICVGLVKEREEILEAFRTRISLSQDEERHKALEQIHLIAELRLKELFE